MNILEHALHILLHLNLYLGDLINEYGIWTYAILFLIVFCETGLVVTPFLPGDSLLFAAGSLFASTQFNIHGLVIMLIVAALCGDNCNYWLGRWLGPKIFHNQTRWLRQEYLLKTHHFYQRYGAKTIIIARFLPIIRTFAPFVAGIATMPYAKYLGLSVIAAILWVCLMVYVGYYFGNIAWVKQNFSMVILAIIVLSLLPPIIELLKHLWKKKHHDKTSH